MMSGRLALNRATIAESIPDLRAALRARLVYMRAELVEMLVRKGVDGGMIALLGSVGGALEALDAIPGKTEPITVSPRGAVE
jgi:hypothetical protein